MSQSKNVNITPVNEPPIFYVSQYDVGRELVCNLVDGHEAYTVPAGATVKIQGTKPSGFGFDEACTASGSTVTITVTETMTAEYGNIGCELVITKNGSRLGSTNIRLIVEMSPHPTGTTDGDEEIIIPELTVLVERAEAAAELLLDCSATATTLNAGSEATASYSDGVFSFGIPKGADGSLSSNVLAPTYSSSATYAVGDYVYYSGSLYRCTTAITTAEAWTAAHWTQVALANDVTDVKSDLSDISDRTVAVKQIYGYLRADNKWGQSTPANASASLVIAISPSTRYLIRSTNTCVGAFLKSLPSGDFWANNTAMSDHYATGASRTTFTSSMNAGTTPSDAKYLVISLYVSGTDWSPTTLEIDGYNYLTSIVQRLHSQARNAVGYVTSNAISWKKSGLASCDLTINSDVIVRDMKNASTVSISKDDLLTLASTATSYVTVSDGVISGTNFALYYDFANAAFKFGSLSESSTYNDSLILFANYYGSYIGGALTETHNSLYEEKVELRKRNSVAYVSSGGISWRMTSLTNCALKITNDIVIRDSDNASVAIGISPEDLYSIASDSSYVTVSDGEINGTAFALYYDYGTASFKIGAFNEVSLYKDALLLFGHFYASYTGGMLVDSLNAICYEQVQNLEIGLSSLSPITVPDFLTSEVSSVVASIEDACTEKAMVIAFTTDNHYGASNGMNWTDTINTIKSINNKYKIDAVIDGGDMINGDELVATSRARLASMLADMNIANVRAYGCVGNHEDNSFTADQEVQIPQEDLYALIGRPTIGNYDTFNNDKVYGYKDYPMFGIRLVIMDSRIGDSRIGDDPLNWGYDTDQISWFVNTALNTDLQVAVFCHMGLTPEYAGSTQNNYPVNGTTIRSTIEAFIGNGGTFIGWFHGHQHWDFIGQHSQTNGFHEVATGCGRVSSGPIPDSWHAPEGATMPERTAGTVTQELYDVIVIKPESREVEMIRFGAGNDRSFTY